MNKRTLSGWSMSLRVQGFLKKKPTEVAAIVGASDVIAALDAKIAAIDTMFTARETTVEGYTLDKQAHQAELVQLSQGYAAILISHAAISKTKTLQKLMKKLKTELGRAGTLAVLTKSNKVYNSIHENLAALTPWNVTAATQTAFLAKIDAYRVLLALPGEKRKSRKELGLQITNQMKEVMAEFYTLDDIFGSILLTSPELVSEYKAMRSLDNPATSKLSAKLAITHLETGLPAEKAIVETPFGVFTSTLKGNVQLKQVERGSYDGVIRLPGCKDKSVTLNIVPGTTFKLAIALEAA